MSGMTAKEKKLNKTLNEMIEKSKTDNKVHDIICYDSVYYRVTINRQPTAARYTRRGTVTVLDPEIMKPLQNSDGKYVQKEYYISNNEDGVWEKNIKEKICAIIKRMHLQIGPTLKHMRVEEEDVRDLSLNDALDLFGEGALEHRYRDNTHGKEYLNTLYRLSNRLGDIPLRKISKRDIKKICAPIAPTTALNYLNYFCDFVNYIEVEKHTSTGLIPIITDAIKNQRRAKTRGSGRSYEKKSMTDVLPNAIELKINQMCADHMMEEPMFIAVALLKGGGLTVEDVINCRMGDLERIKKKDELTIVFVKLYKEYRGSATQNYTFPIFPLEAFLIDQYINKMGEQNPERIQADRFLVSSDIMGLERVNRKDVIMFCRNLLLEIGHQIDYYSMMMGQDLSSDRGVNMLRATYSYRLDKYANLSPETDVGAYTFMRHDNLAPYVQADHYRCFTGDSGRTFLLSCVLQDLRGLPERNRRKNVYYRNQKDDGTAKYTYLPATQENRSHLEMTIVAKEDALAIIDIENGGLFEIYPEDDSEVQKSNDDKNEDAV